MSGATTATSQGPTFREAVRTWARIGLLSFGGPTAQIALMHRVLVDEKRWLDERTFLSALSFCVLLPGPEAMQLATYAGWRLHGLRGGLAAGLLFVLPGALVVLALAMTYAAFGDVPFVKALFFGIKAAVLVIVVEALIRIARRALKGRAHWVIAGLAFVGVFFFAVPLPVVVLAAGLWGYFTTATRTDAASASAQALPPAADLVRTLAVGLALWLVPLVAIATALGGEHVITQLGLFFSKLAVMTFGGAYAVLTYMAQDVVARFGWLDAATMLDALGLAETTPGPLILVTEFVGYLAAYRNDGGGMAMGLLGAAVALWATFVPAFLWTFAGAPYVAHITGQPRLAGALEAITAAAVGMILNLAVWFALHVFFSRVSTVEAGPLRVSVPDPGSLDWAVVALAAVAAVLLLWRRWSILAVLAVCAGLGLMGHHFASVFAAAQL